MANKKSRAYMQDTALYKRANIDPDKGLPFPDRGAGDSQLEEDIRISLRVIDEQRAINRFKWYNLPLKITSQDVERFLYYRGELIFFYEEESDEFFLVPYAQVGSLDAYARPNLVRPLPWGVGANATDEGKIKDDRPVAQIFSKLQLKLRKVPLTEDQINYDVLTKSAVVLRDYTQQANNQRVTLSRQVLNDPILSVMAECIPFMRTALIGSTGVKGVRVNDSDQANSVNEACSSMIRSAKNGKLWLPITASLEFQELTNNSAIKSEEFMMAFKSLDNLALSTYGLDNNGMFEKKAHILEEENEINNSNVSLTLQDGLTQRQNFCNIVNSIWNLGISVELSEDIMNADLNGDGLVYDESQGEATSGTDTSEE